MRNDEILKAFLSDSRIEKNYEIDPTKYKDINSALQAEEPIVHVLGVIISKSERSEQQVYNEIINYLNNAL